MSASFADRLIESVRRFDTPLCVGLDPFADKIPALFGNARDDTQAVLKFGAALIDIAAKHCGVLKPQLGLFEQFGEMGYAVARMLCEHAHAQGMIVILDAKRGDIGTTAEGYARATLGPKPGFAAGVRHREPLHARAGHARAFRRHGAARKQGRRRARARLQSRRRRCRRFAGGRRAGLLAPRRRDARAGNATPARREQLVGPHGGSRRETCPKEARSLREAMPHALFLVPGYGTQGASAADAVAGFVASGKGLEGGV